MTNPRQTKRRDWWRIIRDLMAVGVSMGAIGRYCNRDKGAVDHWANGGEPKDSDARIVLALYKKHCAEKYVAHMQQFDPDYLEERQVVHVKPSNSIRGKPKPRRVAVCRTPEHLQRDIFEEVAA